MALCEAKGRYLHESRPDLIPQGYETETERWLWSWHYEEKKRTRRQNG